ncbi:ArsR family transcriptional regulator [Kitasatospora sp. NPDC101801]|uniref:ArsR/SmtB family transcription factor n=1 Tax=Kitasatospora sp. NPDC101801 TaxID=3364103 RepID=UPI0038085395
MLRIHFTGADLARTRVADRPDPLWETVLSLRALQRPANWPDSEARRREVVTRHAADLPALLPLVRPMGYFPDFLTPPDGALGLEEGLDALLHTAKPRLAGDLAILGSEAKLPSWARELAAGRPGALRRLCDTLRRYYQGVVAPVDQAMQAQVRAERTRRMRIVDESGTAAMLSGLSPSMRWVSPVLEVAYSVSQDLHLDGRGLLLVPTMFRSHTPVSLLDPTLPPILTYPALRRPYPGVADHGKRLEPLLGRTRAAILCSVGERARATTELARLLAVSNASVSQHTAVLREAGLITSTRQRNHVLHAATPLGASLLQG